MSDGTGWPTETDYGWADEREAFCVSFIEATSPKGVLERMVGECETGILSVAEAREWVSEQTEPGYASTIEAGIVGGWVVIVEANGYHLAPVIRRVSTGSRAVVVFRNIHAHTTFLYMVDGIVVRSFHPLLYDEPTPRAGPPLPEESGLDFGSGHPMASAFACAERLTGVRLTLDLLEDHGDWRAIGHHPLHSLTRPGLGAAVTAGVDRQPDVDDPGGQSALNRPFWGDDIDDVMELFEPGWVGSIQRFLLWAGAAPLAAAITAAEHGHEPRFLSLSGLGLALVLLAVGVLACVLATAAGAIDRAWKKRTAGRAEMTDATPHRPSPPTRRVTSEQAPSGSSFTPKRLVRTQGVYRSRIDQL